MPLIIASVAGLLLAGSFFVNETGEAIETTGNTTVKLIVVGGGAYLAYRILRKRGF